MSRKSFEEKRKLEKGVCSVGLAFIPIPPKTTTEGNRQYMAARRRLEKCVDNPAFRRDFIQQYNGFADFLRQYDLNAPDINAFLNLDLHKLAKQKRR